MALLNRKNSHFLDLQVFCRHEDPVHTSRLWNCPWCLERPSDASPDTILPAAWTVTVNILSAIGECECRYPLFHLRVQLSIFSSLTWVYEFSRARAISCSVWLLCGVQYFRCIRCVFTYNLVNVLVGTRLHPSLVAEPLFNSEAMLSMHRQPIVPGLYLFQLHPRSLASLRIADHWKVASFVLCAPASNWILFFQTQTHFCLPHQKGSGHRADRCCPVSPDPTWGLPPSLETICGSIHPPSEVFCGQRNGFFFLGVAGWGRADALVSEWIKGSMTLVVIFKIAANPWSWVLSQHTGTRKGTTNKPWSVRGPGKWV